MFAFLVETPQRLRGAKKTEAIIKPFRMDQVREALIEIGVEGVTVSEVKMLGRQIDHTASSGGDYFSDFLPKLKFEIVAAHQIEWLPGQLLTLVLPFRGVGH
ncbi:MAG TPA: P-II family nitrogen regulator [Chthoniobacterales bacterium]